MAVRASGMGTGHGPDLWAAQGNISPRQEVEVGQGCRTCIGLAVNNGLPYSLARYKMSLTSPEAPTLGGHPGDGCSACLGSNPNFALA
jgi:hypothetical protein